MNNYKKSVVLLSADENESPDVKAITWFSPVKPAPYLLSVGNYREENASDPKEDKVRNFRASPPEYVPETMGKEIISFMKLLAIPHRALGSDVSEYHIDYIGEKKYDKQQKARQRGRPQSQSKHSTTGLEAGPRAETNNNWTALDKEYAPKIGNINARLSHVHGIHSSDRAEIENIVEDILDHDLAKEFGVTGSGAILLHGPGGSGKTMTAVAIANELGASMWEVPASQFIDQYVGQSTKKTENIFDLLIRRAEKNPHVLIVNEMETVFGGKVKSNDSSERTAVLGVVKRQFEYIADEVPNLLIIGTTNDRDALDEAFLRDGRFGLHVYLPLPDENARFDILKDNLSWTVQGQQIFDKEIDYFLPELVRQTDGFSGAAIAKAVMRCRRAKMREQKETKQITPITGDDVLRVLNLRRQQ